MYICISQLKTNIMKKIILILLVSIFVLSSCSRYGGYQSVSGGCGVWFPKKYTGEGHSRLGGGNSPRFGRH